MIHDLHVKTKFLWTNETCPVLCAVDIFGISDHDLMFTQEKCDFEDEGEAEVDPGTDYIQHRVGIN